LTLEDLIASINSEGWIVNNLFQRNTGVWQANLRSTDDRYFTEFGLGQSPFEALSEALSKIETKERYPDPEEVTVPFLAPIFETLTKTVSLGDLMSVVTMRKTRRPK